MNDATRVHITGQGIDLRLKLGDGPAQLEGGFGGWEVVGRPDDVALTEWTGVEPYRMSVPIILDGWRTRDNQQQRFERVIALARRRNDRRPPVIQVFGAVPLKGKRWVVESIDFGAVIRNNRGQLLRQVMTLNLLEYVDPDRIKLTKYFTADQLAEGQGSVTGGTGATTRRTYTTKDGDTLNKISTKIYGDRSQAHAIGRLNGIKDVRRELAAGKRLNLP
jgi:hypothetical protein